MLAPCQRSATSLRGGPRESAPGGALRAGIVRARPGSFAKGEHERDLSGRRTGLPHPRGPGRSARPSAIGSSSEEPDPAAADGIDQREAGPWARVKQCSRARRKGPSEDLPVCRDRCVHLVARQQQEPSSGLADLPALGAGDRRRHPPIPAQLPLDGSDVVEARLDLDDESTGPWIERREVDQPCDLPWTTSTSRRVSQPADRSRRSTYRAPGMDDVSRLWTDDHRRRSDDPEFEAEGVAEPLDHVQRRIRRAALDPRQVARGHADDGG